MYTLSRARAPTHISNKEHTFYKPIVLNGYPLHKPTKYGPFPYMATTLMETSASHTRYVQAH